MILTNKYGYPDTIRRAVENDPYSKGDSEFSATGLIEPPRKRVLTERHKDELIEDVDDRIWSLFGQLGHALVERAGTGLNNLTERRFFGAVANTRISAQIDSLSLEPDGTLIDWKFTGVYGFKKGMDPKREWVAQMNIQKFLIPDEFNVARMRIYGILRDWRAAEGSRSKDYPKKVSFHDIPMYSKEMTGKFIEERVEAHRAAEKELPLCSPDDNWQWKRCSGGYCAVSPFCEQWQGYLKMKKETKL